MNELNTHCTNLNYVLRVLLLKSGKFSEEDIKLKYTWINLSPHQYLKVNVGGRWVNADPWAGTKGMELDKYARGFYLPPKHI